jgi:hypothetical protein
MWKTKEIKVLFRTHFYTLTRCDVNKHLKNGTKCQFSCGTKADSSFTLVRYVSLGHFSCNVQFCVGYGR